MTTDEKRVYFQQLRGWARALVDATEKFETECIEDLPNNDPIDREKERPRTKVARLVRQIGEIHETIERDVYQEPAVA